MGTAITFKRPDGKEAKGYLANAARGNAPGVVVIQEWWGLQDQIKGLCDRFAVAGFDALAPDLYNGVVVPYHDTDAAEQGDELAGFHGRHHADRARRSAVSRAQRRQGRPHRFLSRWRGDGDRLLPAFPNWRQVLRSTAFRRNRRRSPPTSRFRCRVTSPTAMTGARRRWSMRSRGAQGGRKDVRVLSLRGRPRLRQRAADVGA